MLGSDRRRTALAATLFVVLTAFVAVSSAHGAGWRSGVDVSVPQTSSSCGFLCSNPGASGVDVAVNSQGDVVLSWFRREGSVVQRAGRLPPGGRQFRPGADDRHEPSCFLCILGPNSDAAIDDAGRALVVWQHADRLEQRGCRLDQGVRRQLHDRRAAVRLEPDHGGRPQAGDEPGRPRDRRVDAHVAESRRRPVLFAPAGRSFSAAAGLSATSDATTPDAAITGTGAATVTWSLALPASSRRRPGRAPPPRSARSRRSRRVASRRLP